ncbi:MAG: TasA family protein [Aristaeellaceae bacterium]
MSKRKILVVAAALCMVAVLAVGGTLAYLTDTDNATNVFTVGKVDITLTENFDADNAKLLPGSSTVNAVQKEVKITLDSKSEDAYVWYEWLIPAALDDVNDAGMNKIHVNAYGRTWDEYREDSNYWAKDQTEALPLEQTWDHTTIKTKTENINGMDYNVYTVLYHGILSNATKKTETTPAMSQVYMDSRMDTKDGKTYYFAGQEVDYDFSQGVNIIVRAYAIQAEGFADVYAAYAAYTK